jgi:hypothetical protein
MKFLILGTILAVFSSCSAWQSAAKYDMADGKYQLKSGGKKQDCYIENDTGNLIVVHNLQSMATTSLPAAASNSLQLPHSFSKSSLDFDVLTSLFKIRPNIANVLPAQLNANFNGNIYLGGRTDLYKIAYKKNPINFFQRQINHFGFSGGVFIGLGNTALTPSTTNNRIATEYDGIVLQKGVAGILAVNKLSVGLSIGFDNLLNKHSNLWIYQNKLWCGLMLGLNLN